MPVASSLVTAEQNDEGNLPTRYPLIAVFCENCTLVSITETVDEKELFIDNYNYYASFSPTVVEHARNYADEITEKLGLNQDSFVVELASNDGYQLQFFKDKNIDCVGYEPSPGPARAAQNKGIETIEEFFGIEEATLFLDPNNHFSHGRKADLVIANNVLAHVRNINDFLSGIALILDEDGIATFENPWLRLLLDETQFDTIYHEHACYFSTHAVAAACTRHGLEVVNVQYFDKLHGGMLRWTVAHIGKKTATNSVREILDEEVEIGLTTFDRFQEFGLKVSILKDEILNELKKLVDAGKSIAAYGAVAKGVTLTNYLGLTSDDITCVYDRNTNKVGSFMPGSMIPVKSAEDLEKDSPGAVLILSWNFADEIISQQQKYLTDSGTFLVPIPKPQLISTSVLKG